MKRLNENTIKQTLKKIPEIAIERIQEIGNVFNVRIVIKGIGEVQHTKFFLDYSIEINFPKNYPIELPTCSEYGKRKIIKYHHLFEEGNNFCLGTSIELYDRLSPGYNLETYINIITEFLTIYEYYNRYHIMPVTERSHGNKGKLEGYKHLLKVDNNVALRKLINSIPVNNKMRNKKCPCGSGKIMKRCHFNQLSKFSNNRLLRKQMKRDKII